MFGLGFSELIVIFLIALIFIGPKKLPELAKGLGASLKEFQKAAKGFTDQMHETVKDEPAPDLTRNLIVPIDAPKQEEPVVAETTETPKDPTQT